VRLFDEERGTELTVHTGLPDDQSIRCKFVCTRLTGTA